MRPADVPELRGDASKARQKLGWAPETSFEELVHMMVEADLVRNMEGNAWTNQAISIAEEMHGVMYVYNVSRR